MSSSSNKDVVDIEGDLDITSVLNMVINEIIDESDGQLIVECPFPKTIACIAVYNSVLEISLRWEGTCETVSFMSMAIGLEPLSTAGPATSLVHCVSISRI